MLDPARRLAFRYGERLPLARKELAALEILLEADGAVVSAETLLERRLGRADRSVHERRADDDDEVAAQARYPPMIETVTAEGYRIKSRFASGLAPLYGLVSLVAGAALVGISHQLVSRNIRPRSSRSPAARCAGTVGEAVDRP